MEAAARSVLGPIPIGKVLIQTNPETHNPEVRCLPSYAMHANCHLRCIGCPPCLANKLRHTSW